MSIDAKSSIVDRNCQSESAKAMSSSPMIIRISYVTPNFFALLGVRIARGRAFTDAEGRMGDGAMVAVISDRIRRDRFSDSASLPGARRLR